MTVKQLKKLLSKLDPNMDILLLQPNGDAISACYENSGIEEVDFDGETDIVFLLVPCGCGTEEVETSEEDISLN